MNIIQALILGIVQGLTEFLPISSSAHLVLVPFFLNWKMPEDQAFAFDVLVQLGTLVAVIIYFWRDLVAIFKSWISGIAKRRPFTEPSARMGWFLILASIPAGLLGLAIKPMVEAAFSSPIFTGIALLLTAVLLFTAEKVSKRSRSLEEMRWLDALWMGVFQALSIFPGISRSGATIAGGMFRHLDRKSAGKFSFWMSIPVMLAAGGLGTLDLLKIPNLFSFLPVVAIGFMTAGIVGYLAIHWFLSFMMRHSLRAFAFYCLMVGGITILIWTIR